MAAFSEALRGAVRRAAGLVQQRTKRWPATLSDVNGNVTPNLDASVAGQPGLVYCVMPDGSVVKAYNNHVPSVTGLRVWVGYEPHNPTLLRVLDFNASYTNPSPSSGFGPHHATHEWLNAAGGNDVVYSQARQLMPLRLSVVAGFVVKVEPSPYWTGTAWALSTASTLDLTSHVPAGGARWALVYLSAAGALTARDGATVIPGFGSLTYDLIPAALGGETPLAAVALYAGQTQINENFTRQEVVDLRFTRTTGNNVTLDSNAATLLTMTGQIIGLATQSAALVLAGPTSGGAAVPTFRALIASDLPAGAGDPLFQFTEFT